MKLGRAALIIVMGLSLETPSLFAADSQGRFMVGGGVGATSCPRFLNLLAEARLVGGANSPAGIWKIVQFMDYAHGFETGFNYAQSGVSDIFGELDRGPEAGFQILYAVEPWCQQHPKSRFADAIIALAKKLQSHVTR